MIQSLKKKRADTITVRLPSFSARIPVHTAHTIVLGSGAAGLNTAVQLYKASITDTIIITEGLHCGTSINTGSDKQTYYKMNMYGAVPDSPCDLAKTFLSAGSMHGDIALIEAANSVRAFSHLIQAGVPFPSDTYGQYIGYKTDHDPAQRATSTGPYTSRDMCTALINQVKELGVPVYEKREAVALITAGSGAKKHITGVLCIHTGAKELVHAFEIYTASAVVFAVGGPGRLFEKSVYPAIHFGSIGLALAEGAKAQNLAEFQYGIASTHFRWNVSGTYMQAIPRVVSTGPDGKSDKKEFLRSYFPSPSAMHSAVFLKGYQWPFDCHKAVSGSSLIDILIHQETVIFKRRVFLDYSKNPENFSFSRLSSEAREYLRNSDACKADPFSRLITMNKPAADLYKKHGINLKNDLLEIAVCAQHNNGGLTGTIWYESPNITGLFPVGEVNGSHGVCRPGGSALNAGQVAGIRAAARISKDCTITAARSNYTEITKKTSDQIAWLLSYSVSGGILRNADQLRCIQQRMTAYGGHIRSKNSISEAVRDAWAQFNLIVNCHKTNSEITQKHSPRSSLSIHNTAALPAVKDACRSYRLRHMCLSHAVYLDAMQKQIASGTGSRGSALIVHPKGLPINSKLADHWKFIPENKTFRNKILETVYSHGKTIHKWIACRPIPPCTEWFEKVWNRSRRGY